MDTPKGICVRKRESGVLKGTYEFPSVPLKEGITPESTLNEWGMSAFNIVCMKKFTHIFTHIKWEMQTYLVEVNSVEDIPFEVYSLAEIEEKISLPTAFRQCLKIMDNKRN